MILHMQTAHYKQRLHPEQGFGSRNTPCLRTVFYVQELKKPQLKTTTC